MSEAEEALGHPIEIISGLEEARLIYTGVTHSLPPTDGLRLVMDIGGGSTELILGEAAQPKALESLHLGCVSMTERYFSDGCLTARAFEKARLAARLELRPIKAFFRGATDVEVIGTSGTIRATEAVALALGITESGITPAVIEQLIERVLTFDRVDDLLLPELSERRSQVWPGGLAILAELLEVLRIEKLNVSEGALREGLLYDLLGRLQHEDARERTVQAMAARYHVDMGQGGRVAATAMRLFEQCASDWQLQSKLAALILDWSARLHEIGLDISHDGYERHGAYIAENADMPGFPRAEQRYLAFMIGSQRDNIWVEQLQQLPKSWRTSALRLALLLRLAVLLNRSRNDDISPDLELLVAEDSLSLRFDAEWLEANPLTIADLEREQALLDTVGYSLRFG